MHSSRMRTDRAMTSRISYHACLPFAMHAPLHHTCPPFTMHAPLLPCMPPSPCMPPIHHACPPGTHAALPLGATIHNPGSNHACHPPMSSHACPPGATTHAPPCGQTDTCKNITFANFVCGR